MGYAGLVVHRAAGLVIGVSLEAFSNRGPWTLAMAMGRQAAIRVAALLPSELPRFLRAMRAFAMFVSLGRCI